jgi:N5-(cytidine 5'-diphosphoramidyl)-L-glutamine hydrolase
MTQIVAVERSERRDCLDQRWYPFLKACGLTPILLPNRLETAKSILENVLVNGVLLTGGNDLFSLGGDAPERDELETFLVNNAIQKQWPLIGVCRGMQLIQSVHGIPLERIEGHVVPELEIAVDGKARSVNSYHRFGTKKSSPTLVPWAVAKDGIIKAVRHVSAPVLGIMWHPERYDEPRNADIELFNEAVSSRK